VLEGLFGTFSVRNTLDRNHSDKPEKRTSDKPEYTRCLGMLCSLSIPNIIVCHFFTSVRYTITHFLMRYKHWN